GLHQLLVGDELFRFGHLLFSGCRFYFSVATASTKPMQKKCDTIAYRVASGAFATLGWPLPPLRIEWDFFPIDDVQLPSGEAHNTQPLKTAPVLRVNGQL